MAYYQIYSFGCRVNQAESEWIARELEKALFVPNQSSPDLIIINTCAVTQKAEREAKNLIYQIKRQHPRTFLVVTGCAGTYWLKNSVDESLKVDLIINNQQKKNLINEVITRFETKQIDYSNNNRKIIVNKYLSSGRTIIKIQDGCQRFCSYCIVPFLRGAPISKPINEIVTMIKQYEKQNIKEAILTAINSEAYGLAHDENLNGLIDAVINRTKIPRISFGSINPWSITQEFIETYKKVIMTKRFVDFFHIPLQSGSNKILNLMKRGYSREEFMENIISLYKVNPLALFATDVIVGFLEENDKDFEDTYKYLDRSPISKFHVFRFSLRKDTSAYYLAKKLNKPDLPISKTRSSALRILSERKYLQFQAKFIGKSSEALFIRSLSNGYQEALLDNQLPVLIESNKSLLAEIKNVKITAIKTGRLIGKLI